jgi:hypothetical protein
MGAAWQARHCRVAVGAFMTLSSLVMLPMFLDLGVSARLMRQSDEFYFYFGRF